MDYGGVDRRKTKGDLKRKRKNRVYKKGGQFRSHNVSEESMPEKKNVKSKKNKRGKKK